MTTTTHGATHGALTEPARTDSRQEGKGREGNRKWTSVPIHRHLGNATRPATMDDRFAAITGGRP